MDILDVVADFANKLSNLGEAASKDTIRKKPAIRKRFYMLVKDYLSSSGTKPLNDFFEWYITQLDKRMEIAPQWQNVWYRLTRSKNSSNLRSFLEACHRSDNPDFKEKIKDWIPQDEYMILASQQKSDITEGLLIVIDICEEKENTGKQAVKIFFAALPSLVTAAAMHTVLYKFVYPVFVRIDARDTWDIMNAGQKVYFMYNWLSAYSIPLFIILAILTKLLFISVRNWSKRGMFFRENYIDCIPPYSLSKLKAQYNIVSLTYNYLRCGLSDFDAISEVKNGSDKYTAYQVGKITNQVNVKTTDAFNTLFMGDYGCDIAERGQYVNLQESLKELMGGMKERYVERVNVFNKILFTYFLNIVVYGSIAASIVPLIFAIGSMLPDKVL
ncbi:hypothetical protein [Alteromonas sp. 14N.309.X.WAT.G.H12]|uniref:hypothetical protein n=1 Tax=Alteromonas sp. 14N.309.X.WAT.G.H12 TaxID=3120824 RepID=UPI002FD5ED6C